MDRLFDINAAIEFFPRLLGRLHITFFIVFLAIVIGIIVGVALAYCRHYKIPVFNQLALVYISFMRGTPIIIQLFLFFHGLPVLLNQFGINILRWDRMFFVVLTYGLNTSAFLAEVFRSSIASVPKGQSEAAYSVGLTKLQTFYRIVIPQATIVALPLLGTVLVLLLHHTSIAFTLGVIDVIGEVRIIGSRTRRYMEGYVGAAVIFLILSFVLEKLFQVMEKKLIIRKGK